MRLVVLTLSVWLLLGCNTPFQHTGGTPLTRIEDSYLSVGIGVPGVLGALGSAVVVADGLAVTNAHVAGPGAVVLLQTRDGRRYHAGVAAVSDRLDLALLKLPEGFAAPAPIATRRVRAGEPVWLMGTTFTIAPTAQAVVVTTDLVSEVHAIEAAPGVPRMDIGARRNVPVAPGFFVNGGGGPGYSGGPVVSAAGEVVGLTQAIVVQWFDTSPQVPDPEAPILFAYFIDDVMAEVERLLTLPSSHTQAATLTHLRAP